MTQPMEPQPRRVLDTDVVAIPADSKTLAGRGYICNNCVFGPTKSGGLPCTPRLQSVSACTDVVFWLPQDYATYRLTGDVPNYKPSSTERLT